MSKKTPKPVDPAEALKTDILTKGKVALETAEQFTLLTDVISSGILAEYGFDREQKPLRYPAIAVVTLQPLPPIPQEVQVDFYNISFVYLTDFPQNG